LGCKVGFSQLGRLDLDYDQVVEYYSLNTLADSQDLERRTRILDLLSQEFSLEPWADVSSKLRRLETTWHKTIQNTC
jgi:archaellum biogenesis protein FlaJ (TadC family)